MPRDPHPTRDRIIAAAQKLYYGQGIRSASIDAIAARAGVTKRTLYYHFRSKDDLVAAYLTARDQPTLAILRDWMDEVEGPLARKIEALFVRIGQMARHPKWKGCGFLRTAAELASTPGHPAVKVGAAHKKKVESMFAEMIAAEGLDDPALRARQIAVLFDGAFTEMLVHRDPAYADAAGRAAVAIVTPSPRR